MGEGGDAVKMTLTAAFILLILSGIAAGLYFGVTAFINKLDEISAAQPTSNAAPTTTGGGGAGVVITPPNTVGAVNIQPWTDPAQGARLIDILSAVLEILADILGARLQKAIDDAEERRRRGFDNERGRVEDAEREKRAKAAADADADNARPLDNDATQRALDEERAKAEEAERQKRSRAAGDADADNARPVDNDATQRALDEERAKAEEAERGRQARAAGDADAGNARPLNDDATQRALDEERAKAEEAERGRQARAAGDVDAGVRPVSADAIQSALDEERAKTEEAERQKRARTAGDADAGNARPLDNEAAQRALDEERAKAEEAERGRQARAAGDVDAGVRPVSADVIQSALKEQLADAEEAERQKRARTAGDADAGNARPLNDDATQRALDEERAKAEEAERGRQARAAGDVDAGVRPVSADAIQSALDEERAKTEEAERGRQARAAGETDAGNARNIDPTTVKGSIEAENARINENIKASGNDQLPKTPGSAIDPTTVKGSIEAENARINENIKASGNDQLPKTPGSAIDPTTVKGSIEAENARINENIKASGNDQLPKTPGSAIDPTTVKGSIEAENARINENIKASGNDQLPKTPGSAIDPTTVKGSIEAENARINENIKASGNDKLPKAPGSTIDPTTVKGSIEAENARINENIKASGNDQLPKTPGSIDPTTVKGSIEAENARINENIKASGNDKLPKAPGSTIDPTTVKGSIEAENARINENIKASGNDQLPKTPGSIDPTTVKGSIEAENARINENIKNGGIDELTKNTPGAAIDPTTVKGSLEAENVRVNEDIKNGGIDELTKNTPGAAINPATVKGSLEAENVRINEDIKKGGIEELTKNTPGSAIDPATVQRSLIMKARAAFDNLTGRAQPLLPFSTKVDRIPRTATLWATKMVEGNHKLGDNGQPEKVSETRYDTSHMQYMPSEKWFKTAFTSFGVALSNMFQRNPEQMQALKDIMATEHTQMTARKRTPIFLSTTDEKSRMRSAFDYTMSSKVVSVTGALLGTIGDVMDVLGVVMLFTDAFYMDDAFLYYGQDRPPPGSGYQPKLLTPDAVNEAIARSIDGQVKAIKDYNKMCKTMNNPDNLPAGSQTYAYATYPQISGPLDVLERDMPRKTAYDTQARIVEEVNAVQEKLLRDPTTTHGALMQQRMGGQTYQYLIDIGKYNAQTNPGGKNMWWWLGGVDGYFAPTEIDNLYRAAFTAVCLYHKGVVYEDTHLGVDSTGSTETQSSGRARFQCGWPTSADCIKASQKWVTDKGATGGNYAEWFNFDDLKGFTETATGYDYAAPKVNKIPAANLTLLKRTNPGACIVYNSGIRQMCDMAKGHYNPISHQCVFSPQFCQSIGTCYDRRTRTCNLPPDAMKALGVFFGDYAPREYIRQNGCNYTSADDITQEAITSGDITTENGQDWKRDKAASNINLNANFRNLLSSPAYGAGFATSVTGLAQIAGQAAITAAGEAVVDSGSRFAVSDTKATTALQKANKPVTTATVKAQRIAMTAGRLNMAIAAAQILIIAFTIVSELVSSNQIRNQMPTDDIKEYTVGGWDTDTEGKPRTLSFANGWVTKPLSITSITSTEAGGWNRRFYADSYDLAWKAGAGGIYENILSSDLSKAIDRYTGYFTYPDAPARSSVTNRAREEFWPVHRRIRTKFGVSRRFRANSWPIRRSVH
jgi:hypothetical protein